MEVKTIKISEKGQIAIPQVIREKLNLQKGDELILFYADGKVLLEKSQRISEEIKDDFADLLKFSEQALKDVWDNEEDNIWDSYLKK